MMTAKPTASSKSDGGFLDLFGLSRKQKRVILGGTCAVLGLGLSVASCYRIARPGEYLVRTGLFVRGTHGMDVMHRGLFLPGCQSLTRVPIQPDNVVFLLPCLSDTYLPFNLPVTAAVSPRLPTDAPITEKGNAINGETLFKRYVERLFPLDKQARDETLKAIIHGQMRLSAAKLPINAMNDNREAFKADVIFKIQEELWRYGVNIDSMNIAEIIEEARERKQLTDAAQQSEMDVSEAQKAGDIDKKSRESDIRQAVAKLEADTKRKELLTQQQIARAKADLAVVKAEANSVPK